MPKKPKRPCSSPGCPELTNGRFCSKHQKEVNKKYNKDRNPLNKKHYDSRWEKIRERYVSLHPLCMQCLKEDKLVPTEEVHHIVPLTKGGKHDDNNLMALCKSCHSQITAREGGRWG